MPLTARWKRLSHFWRHVAINLVLAGCVEILLHLFHDAPVVQKAENTGLDATIAFFGARGGDRTSAPGQAFMVFDIDDATWRAWGSPNLTPRDKLNGMLRLATSASAAAVVVDLDLTRREAANGLLPSAGDSALGSFLRAYQGPVPIILVRRLEYGASGSAGLPAPVHAWFEPLPEPAARWIHWGTVQFVEEADAVVRRWRLWEPVCEDARPSVLPSAQLMLGATLDSSLTPAGLRQALAPMAPPDCNHAELRDAGSVKLWGHQLRPLSENLPQRIIYSLRWPPEAGPTRMVRLANGNILPMLVGLPASQASGGGDQVDRRLLEGRIVVIGGTYSDSRDWYATPLGRMPGMTIVVNAIESLRRYGQFGAASSIFRWVVMVVLLLLTSLAYARYHPLVATLLLTPLIYVAILPISFYLFQGGAWLDFTAPLLGVQLHELIAGAESAWVQRGKRFDPTQEKSRGHHK